MGDEKDYNLRRQVGLRAATWKKRTSAVRDTDKFISFTHTHIPYAVYLLQLAVWFYFPIPNTNTFSTCWCTFSGIQITPIPMISLDKYLTSIHFVVSVKNGSKFDGPAQWDLLFYYPDYLRIWNACIYPASHFMVRVWTAAVQINNTRTHIKRHLLIRTISVKLVVYETLFQLWHTDQQDQQ